MHSRHCLYCSHIPGHFNPGWLESPDLVLFHVQHAAVLSCKRVHCLSNARSSPKAAAC